MRRGAPTRRIAWMVEAVSTIDPASGRPRATRTLWSVQCLRGAAALMVVVGHAQSAVALNGGDRTFHRSTALPWGGGVDLFFVISGFIMVHASRRLFGAPDARRRFLTRRLARIAPLYWLTTAAMLTLLAAASLKGGDPFPRPSAILASLAFFPFDTWRDGALYPVVDLGWTLNYEMFFYAVFAIFVAFPRRPASAGVALTMTGLALAGTVVPAGSAAWFWSRPIILDFVLGLLAGVGSAERRTVPGWARVGLAAAAMLVFVADPAHLFARPAGFTVANNWSRVLWAGGPCAVLLAAATWGPEPRRPAWLAPLTAIGDASYSLYLLPPFALIVLEKLMQKSAAVRAAPGWALVTAVVAAAIALALTVFRTVERPITARLTRSPVRRPRSGWLSSAPERSA